MIQQINLYRRYLIPLIFCIPCFIPQSIFSQNIINVNNLTGTANVTIPIYNVSVGDLSAPVALSYSASGLKVENFDNSFGQGWRLIADAAITRLVRGFPDDVEYQSESSYSVIKGWIRPGNTAPQVIQSLTFANTGSSNCANEITDATTIANNFSYTYDTEPDQFYVSAPGLSCSFVFDATTNHIIKTIPYRDYQITYTTDSYGKITAFTVINENGIKYYFDMANLMEHYIETYNPGTTVEIDPSNLEAFKRDYMMYRNKTYLPGIPIGVPLKYNEKWTLSKMEDTKGNRINFNYQNYSISNPVVSNRDSYKEIEILKPDGSGGFTKKKLFGITTKRVDLQLLSISVFSLGSQTGSFQTVVQFSWVTPSGSSSNIEDAKLVSIDLPIEKKKYELLYTKKFLGFVSSWTGYGRYFLKGLKASTTSGLCSNVNTQFDFTYYNVNEANNTCYCTPVNPNTNQTIDTIVNAQDYWGYYNGNFMNPNLNPAINVYPDNTSVELFKVYQIPGYSGASVTLPETANRVVNSHAIDGSLKKITYPTSSTTELEYENNEFFDTDVNGNVLGGGIRIKKITNDDGLVTIDVTEYSYNDPVNTSITTGRAISVPKFAMAFQNNNSYGNITDRVKYSTYRTTYDLNNEPKDILYAKVTVKKTDGGKSLYEYNTSGTFGSSDITDWQESKNYVARTNLSSPTPCTAIAPSFLYSNNAELQYPFTSDPNYDFERGLPTKVTHYNEAGQVVASEDYTYARSHTNPTKIYGVKLDDIGNTMTAYSKYAMNTIVDNFLVTKTSKLYNSNSATPITDVESYEYTSPGSSLNYRLLKSVSKQNSGDPATTFSRFKYAKEYTATNTPGGDFRNYAIYNLNNSNRNVLIESSQSRTEPGQPEKVTGASFNTFKKFTIGDVVNSGTTTEAYLPYESYQFVNQAGVTNFVWSTITSNAFTWDNTNYTNIPSSIEQYNARGIPQLITDNSRIPKAILSTTVVNSVKVAEFTNAKPEHVAFSNFDAMDFTGNFTLGGNAIQAGGRYSGYYLSFQPNTAICRVLDKSPTAKNVIISFWLKDAQSNGSIYFCSSKFGCSGSACSSNPVVSFTTGSQWKYYQVAVPWPHATLTTFTFYLGTSAAVKIDDVLIYPDNANVTTYSYTSNTLGTNMLTAKTGINGIGNSYEYDKAGRLWLVRDQFDNIIEMKKYKLANRHLQQIPSIEIGYPHYPVANTTATLSASPPFAFETGDCDAPQIEYTWDFGDGTTGVPSSGTGEKGSTTITHIYTNPGKYQVSVTASSPGMTNINAQTPATTSTDPHPLEVVAATPPCYPGTPVICASGITWFTSASQCILTTCTTTPALPSTCSDTYFKVIGNSGGQYESVYSVQWETAPAGTSNWSVYQQEPPNGAPGGKQTRVHFNNIHTSSYQMRARVRFCDQFSSNTAYSNTILIRNGD